MDTPDFAEETTTFQDIAAEFQSRVSRMVWCNVATVDDRGRPRSRLMHPIWDGPVGWIGTWLTSVRAGHATRSLKIRQIERNPYASLAYVSEPLTPVYVDCHVEVIEDVEGKRPFCDLACSLPPPYGFDPTQFFGGLADPRFGVLRLVASRIALVEFPAPPGKVIVWRAAP